MSRVDPTKPRLAHVFSASVDRLINTLAESDPVLLGEIRIIPLLRVQRIERLISSSLIPGSSFRHSAQRRSNARDGGSLASR
jgi:hypothetical protein